MPKKRWTVQGFGCTPFKHKSEDDKDKNLQKSNIITAYSCIFTESESLKLIEINISVGYLTMKIILNAPHSSKNICSRFSSNVPFISKSFLSIPTESLSDPKMHFYYLINQV